MQELDWNAFYEQCSRCAECRLAQNRTNIVIGAGVPDTEVMFIGEGPGEQEDLKGEPFVGRGGQLLDKMLAAVGLSRKHNIYIANIVKCRPPNNRDPLPDEQESCIKWLKMQVLLIKPKIIVCLGRVAACRIIDEGYKVTRQHGEFIEKGGVLMMGTFHPAALLRNPGLKPAAFADLIGLRDKIEKVCEKTKLVY
jgi:uracil-DNA glycosylase family 4